MRKQLHESEVFVGESEQMLHCCSLIAPFAAGRLKFGWHLHRAFWVGLRPLKTTEQMEQRALRSLDLAY